MIEIHNAMIANNIPVGIYEFDSWWYYRNYSGDGYTGNLGMLFNPHKGLGGVLLWEPRPDVFPDGASFLGTPLWLHVFCYISTAYQSIEPIYRSI